MPRILVADDNSNIQKMVALAFKNDGIEVIAVGNGDAAIRKLPEQVPDLVLADVFMPVRNGYEVCEFIKMDSRFMHIPVVLLVGAFDPLDEREAQRVHADGVLKKPFVPPDPLISIVRALLAKSAGERLVAAAVPAAAISAVGDGKQASAPMPASAPVPAPSVAPAVGVVTAELAEELPSVEEFAAPASARADEFLDASALSPRSRTAPVELASLVEEIDDPTLQVTASRDPILGEPAFWKTPAQADPTGGDDAAEAPDVVVEEVTADHSWGARSRHGRGGESAESASSLPPIEPILDPGESRAPRAILENVEPAEAERSPEHVPVEEEFAQLAAEITPMAAAPAGMAASEVPADPETERTPSQAEQEFDRGWNANDDAVREPRGQTIAFPSPVAAPEGASAEPFGDDESQMWTADPPPPILEFPRESAPANVMGSGNNVGAGSPDALASASELSDSIESEGATAPAASAAPELAMESPALGQAEMAGEFAAVPDSDFEEDLASSGEGTSPEAPQTNSMWPPIFRPVLSSEENAAASAKIPTEGASLDSAPPPDIRNDENPEAVLAPEPAPDPAQNADQPQAPSPDVVDALVARIIERMQPQIMEVVTREILRPVVETLVRRELEKQ